MLDAAPPNEPGNTHATAGLLPNGTYTSTLAVEEVRDVYRIEVAEFSRISVRLEGVDVDARFEVWSEDVRRLDGLVADVPANRARGRALDLPAGNSFLRISRGEGVPRDTASDYTFATSVAPVGGTAPGSTQATAGQLSVGYRNGFMSAPERIHYYRFTVDHPGNRPDVDHNRMRVTVQLPRLFADLQLRVERAGGQPIPSMTSEHDANAREFVSRELAPGDYWIRVYQAELETEGGYQLKLTITQPDERIAGPTRNLAGRLDLGVNEHTASC